MLQLDVAQTVDDEAIAAALAPWLDDLESRLDPSAEERLLQGWKDFAAGRNHEAAFSPRRRCASPPRIDWPILGIDDAIHDPQRMVLRQLKGCSDRLASGDGMLLCVRSDYGTGILPSLFGVPVVCMARAADTLPGTTPLGRDAMASLVAAGAPGLQAGLWPLVRSIGRTFVTCLRGRPGLQRHLHIYHPDLQGPMDVLEMLWGSDCFTAFVEETDLVHAVLRLISDTYVNAMADWDAVVPDQDPGWCAHWGFLHRGHIMLRDDSAMNLSPRMFRELCAPYDGELLQRLGGGAMHACGRVGHFLAEATALPGLHAFNFGQPDLNEAERIQQSTVDRGVHIIGLGRQSFEKLCAAGFQPRGLVHVQ